MINIKEYLNKSALQATSSSGYDLGFLTLIWKDMIVRVEIEKVVACKTPIDLEKLIKEQGIVMLELNKQDEQDEFWNDEDC